jgi:transposase
LFLGTQKDNVQDAKRKGRLYQGEKHRSAKLTEKEIVEIRRKCRNGVMYTTLAEYYAVHPSVIYDAAVGNTWRGVKEPFTEKRNFRV